MRNVGLRCANPTYRLIRKRSSRKTDGGGLLLLPILCACLGILACSDSPAGNDSSNLPPQAPVYGYTVVRTYPHDRQAFTQGLAFDDQGALYESTGQRGQSSLRRVELSSGAVLQRHDLPASLFGEGITVFGDCIIQLTWQAGRAFVYDRDTFSVLREFTYRTEGWGLTHDGQRLIMSDGTATLSFRHPDTFAETARLTVRDHRGPVIRLNELEYVGGEILANVWQTDRIARIDPRTGHVTGWIDLTGLLPPSDRRRPVDVLNGIAHDTRTNRLFVTGKWWPKLFEITLMKTSG